jgi:Tol biopolymer transport system component
MGRALSFACGFVLLAWCGGAGAGADGPGGARGIRNGKIAFVSAGDVWVVDPDGNGLTNLTHSPAREAYPTWSPEGTRIVFSSNRGGRRELWIMDVTGEGPRRLTHNRRGGPVDSCPSVSPDGRRVVFARRSRGNQELWVMNLDGTGLRRLTRYRGIDFAPAWSPDGTEIVFWRQLRRGKRSFHQVFVMEADGTGLRQLTWGSSSDAPSWSPDGKRIVYTRVARARGDLWLMRGDGGARQRLTRGPADDDYPVWSPDGSAVAFTSDRADGTRNLYVVPVRGQRLPSPTRLTRIVDRSGREDVLTPAWEPIP